jgi:hypothetical protein
LKILSKLGASEGSFFLLSLVHLFLCRFMYSSVLL